MKPLNYGDLLYDLENIGIIVDISGNEYIIEWLSAGLERNITSNRNILLKWRAQAAALRDLYKD